MLVRIEVSIKYCNSISFIYITILCIINKDKGYKFYALNFDSKF